MKYNVQKRSPLVSLPSLLLVPSATLSDTDCAPVGSLLPSVPVVLCESQTGSVLVAVVLGESCEASPNPRSM